MKELPDIIYALAALCSALTAILAWIAKLKWSKEFADAKDATIQAKDAELKTKDAHIDSLKNELENLRDFTPMKIREYFLSVTSQLNEYNDVLQKQIDDAQTEIEKKQKEIVTLRSDGTLKITRIQELENQKDEIQQTVDQLKSQMDELKQQETLKWTPLQFAPHFFMNISDSSRKLDNAIAHDLTSGSSRIAELSASLQNTTAIFSTGFKSIPGFILPRTATEPKMSTDEVCKGKRENRNS